MIYHWTGRRILLTYITLVLLISLNILLLYLDSRGTEGLPARLVRLQLTVILCYFLYRGSKFAKWIAVVLFTLGGAMAAPFIIDNSLEVSIISGILAAIYLSFAWVLIWSERVNEFLDQQRRRYNSITK